MTPLDRLEGQLPAAFTDLADERTPDYLIDILGQTARSRQRPAWTFPGRWFPTMPAITARPALAIVAIVIVAILGGAFLLNRPDQSVGNQTSPSPDPSATPYASPLPLPSALVGGWLAPLRESPIAQGRVSALQFGALNGDATAPDFAISGTAAADVQETTPGVIRLTSTGALGGCSTGDVAEYRWSISGDGVWLTLEPIDDTCSIRAAMVPGTWIRSGNHDSRGGPLVAAAFEPFFSFTVPSGVWLGGGGAGVMTADYSDRTFKVWQDPDAFNDYCDDAMGTKVLERGIDPFLQFLREDSGLDVSNERETTIDGHRAVIVDIVGKPDVPPPCWTNPDTGETNMILQWTQHADVGWKWATGIGGTPWPIVIAEVGGHTLVFEDVWGANDLDQEVLDSIRFLDALPSPPTP
ncbi:MAG: hypothetical protein ACJ771_06465 [Chloroflexota bacterium]